MLRDIQSERWGEGRLAFISRFGPCKQDKSISSQQHCYAFPEKKTFSLAGIEPGSSGPQMDAMTTAPHRQGSFSYIFSYQMLFLISINLINLREAKTQHLVDL
jgi:hypothetical protein